MADQISKNDPSSRYIKTPDRILIAEDSPDAQNLLSKNLKKHGYDVEVVGDGEECLEKFMNSEFSLVLLDFVMPKRNGLEVLEEIRKYRKPEELPVILLTGKQDKELLKKAIRLGVNDFLVKPIRSSQLVERIKRTLQDLTPEEVKEILRSANFVDPSGLSPDLKDMLTKQHLSAYPLEYKGTKLCVILSHGKNPHVEAKKDLKVLQQELIIMAKGAFLWNIVWPRSSMRIYEVPNTVLGSKEDLIEIIHY